MIIIASKTRDILIALIISGSVGFSEIDFGDIECLLTLLTPRSDEHVTSPDNIHALLRKHVMEKLRLIR